MTDAEIAESIRQQLAARANDGGAGTVSVSIDGITTQYSIDSAIKELAYWEKRAARAAGKKRIVQTIDLRNA